MSLLQDCLDEEAEERAAAIASGEPYYPDIEVQLTAEDGNGFFIIGRVMGAMARAKVPKTEIDLFRDEAMSGDYNYLLQTCAVWVTVS